MSGRRNLSDEERKLWQRTIKSVNKLSPHSAPDIIAPKPSKSYSPTRTSAATPPKPVARGTYQMQRNNAQHLPSSPLNSKSVIGAGDPGYDRRVSRRRIPIDRTLDLHGLTQRAAEISLFRFVEQAFADHCRCILIITGKGSLEHQNRGVLHQRLPEWVNAENLQPMISRVANASRKDGGDGAWYVFLKQKPRLKK